MTRDVSPAEMRRLMGEWGERFWAKIRVDPLTGCWVWVAAQTRGYGRFRLNGKNRKVSRITFETWWGVTLPRWLHVCHDCPGGDNPACCNPAHFFVSDMAGHAQDTKSKGQLRPPRGERSGSRTKPESRPRGSKHWCARINEWQAVGIMARWLQGTPISRIAIEFGLSDSQVGGIVNGREWKHLFEEVSIDS